MPSAWRRGGRPSGSCCPPLRIWLFANKAQHWAESPSLAVFKHLHHLCHNFYAMLGVLSTRFPFHIFPNVFPLIYSTSKTLMFATSLTSLACLEIAMTPSVQQRTICLNNSIVSFAISFKLQSTLNQHTNFCAFSIYEMPTLLHHKLLLYHQFLKIKLKICVIKLCFLMYSFEGTDFVLIKRMQAIITAFIAFFFFLNTALFFILSYARRKLFPRGFSFPLRQGSLKIGFTIPNTNPYS